MFSDCRIFHLKREISVSLGRIHQQVKEEFMLELRAWAKGHLKCYIDRNGSSRIFKALTCFPVLYSCQKDGSDWLSWWGMHRVKGPSPSRVPTIALPHLAQPLNGDHIVQAQPSPSHLRHNVLCGGSCLLSGPRGLFWKLEFTTCLLLSRRVCVTCILHF